MKSLIQCPGCGEYHEFDKKVSAEKLVCLHCDQFFSPLDFQPFAIAYRKKGS
ncbi:MAG: hypothetical protein JEY91_11515 [Spirochaetaceae bacterium]|nr:hypothetical protein [Spirochaetaceae bacterium]